MDYEELLKKYMSHVIDCESVSFVSIQTYVGVPFSQEEHAKLLEIEETIRNTPT